MADAHARDQAAWELAGSGGPLLEAFRGYRNVDQYGGLLYLSALVYRYAGGNSHMPLLIIVLTASISALSVLFTWAFVQRTLGEKVAELAAWILLFYPDAIIQGSSQMREGFLMAMVPVACYGLARFRQDRSWSGLGFIFCGLVLTLPFSPPVSGILLVTLAILAVSLEGWQILRQVRFWIVLGGIALVAGIGIWVAWGRIAPEGISNPLALISWWITQTARWQQLFIRRTTDVVRGLFRMTPDWSHTPILVAYGVLQPFLPAAITDDGVPIWKGIAIWRSIGWNAMLTFLLAAPFISWTRDSRRRLIIGLVLAVWGVILLASLRSGGDQWDNPRYRVIFISLQATIAAWAWFEGRENKQPWLSWALTSLVIALAWVIPWDLHRDGIITWPVTDIFTTMWLALASVILYLSWNLIRKRIRKGRNDGEKTEL
jgi:Dolichyl-phosphate-mannose-protein mannosyltransferase